MSSVLIKGLIMPKNCTNCKFSYSTNYIEMKCLFVDEACKIHGRLPNCPLVEIPTPHGRLIDEERLKSNIEKHHCNDCDNYNGARCSACWVDDCFFYIDDTQTIIEAEVSE